jgi:predicted amidophosphoribosyltransferase
VLALKLRHLRDAAQPLVEAMVSAFYRHGLGGETVSWVPARRRDIRIRGFDHAEVLARALAQRVGLPAAALLERRGTQRDQSGLGREERSVNLQGAFRAPETLLGPSPGRVLLVDDLVTTGATASACSSALRATGVVRVGLLAACRA